MDNETLHGIFRDAGEEFGVEVVSAEFQPFKDLKVRWRRCSKTIDFSVTDYLREAPEGILEELAHALISKIYCDPDIDYSDAFVDWVTSDEFIRLNRDTYLQRSNVLSEDFQSRFHSLQETYEDLVSKGAIEEIPNLSLRWSDNRAMEPLGASSVLMRSVIIPTYLDNEKVPQDLFEFNLFRLLTNVETDFGIEPAERKEISERRIKAYPDSERLLEAIEDHRNLAMCGVI